MQQACAAHSRGPFHWYVGKLVTVGRRTFHVEACDIVDQDLCFRLRDVDSDSIRFTRPIELLELELSGQLELT